MIKVFIKFHNGDAVEYEIASMEYLQFEGYHVRIKSGPGRWDGYVSHFLEGIKELTLKFN